MCSRIQRSRALRLHMSSLETSGSKYRLQKSWSGSCSDFLSRSDRQNHVIQRIRMPLEFLAMNAQTQVQQATRQDSLVDRSGLSTLQSDLHTNIYERDHRGDHRSSSKPPTSLIYQQLRALLPSSVTQPVFQRHPGQDPPTPPITVSLVRSNWQKRDLVPPSSIRRPGP
jgi:hypothetical protein